jgi:hypothetical protein
VKRKQKIGKTADGSAVLESLRKFMKLKNAEERFVKTAER